MVTHQFLLANVVISSGILGFLSTLVFMWMVILVSYLIFKQRFASILFVSIMQEKFKVLDSRNIGAYRFPNFILNQFTVR